MPRQLSSPLFIVIFLFSGSVCAQRDRDTYNPGNQSFEVSGQVSLAGSNILLHDIPVRLERFSGGVIDQMSTDARGRFRFGNLQRGYYKVIISAPGYRPSQQDADLTTLFKSYLVFVLSESDPKTNAAGYGADVIDARVPPNARDEFSRGREALAKSNQSDAIAHFQKALAMHSQFFEAELLLGTAYMDRRDWQQAEMALSRALELKPDDPAATLALGEVFWRQKRLDQAERTLLDGLRMDEKNWHGHFTLARLYWEREEVMKAAPEIGRTLQLKPDFAEAHVLAGNILLRLNQPQRALVEYQEYLRLAPKGEYAGEARDLVDKLQKAAQRASR